MQLQERVLAERRQYEAMAERRAAVQIEGLKASVEALSRQAQEGQAAQEALDRAQGELDQLNRDLKESKQRLKAERSDREKEQVAMEHKLKHEVQLAADKARAESEANAADKLQAELIRWRDQAREIAQSTLHGSDGEAPGSSTAVDALAEAIRTTDRQSLADSKKETASIRKAFLSEMQTKESKLQSALSEARAAAVDAHLESLKAAQSARAEEQTR